MPIVNVSQEVRDDVIQAFRIWWETKYYAPSLRDLQNESPYSTATILNVLTAAAQRGEITQMEDRKFYPNHVAEAMRKAAQKGK